MMIRLAVMTLGEKIDLLKSGFKEVAFGYNDSGSFWHFQYGPRGAGDMMQGFGKKFCAVETETDQLEEAVDALLEKLIKEGWNP